MTHQVDNDILIPELASLVASGRSVSFTPSGVSMRPFIEGGRDRVTLVQPVSLRVGDIVLARYHDMYVLHRVIRIEGDKCILMGDGNLSGTEQVWRADILAKVAEIRTPSRRRLMTRGRIWYHLLPIRRYLLRLYRMLC